ncbi:MAG: CoA-binding protein [Candidatus Helarchaeota archaeon]
MDESYFNPRGIAIIGASPGYFSGGSSFLQSLLAAEYPKEKLFPINPKYQKINGIKAYPTVVDVPDSKPIDYCIIAVPKKFTYKALEDCVKKQIKLVCCFSSGFGEIGKTEDEAKFADIAKKGGIRLLGPNCIGICVPKNRISFNQGIRAGEEWAGEISVISQSGGNADAMMISGNGIGLKFNKVVSYGNGSDINADELLEFFKDDPDTKIILQYLEGFKTINQGRNYLRILRETTPKKPVIIWQGGITPVGKRSIFSHTGSVSGDNRVIRGAFRQAGAILIDFGGDILLYTPLLISYLQKTSKLMKIGPRIGAILGGGGNNVYFSDLCTIKGLSLPEFHNEHMETIKEIIGEIGTLLKNPIDMNIHMFNVKKVVEIMKFMDKIDYIDVITFEPGLDWGIMNAGLMQRLNPNGDMDFKNIIESNVKTMVRNIKKIKKPVIILSAQTFCEAEIVAKRYEFEERFRKANIPVINNAETMTEAIKHVIEYKEYLSKLQL